MVQDGVLSKVSLDDFGGCFRDKKVLITGHTGFKGSWLSIWLSKLGAQISGIALDPSTRPNNYELSSVSELMTIDLRMDVRNRLSVERAVAEISPDVIFHLAGQPILAEGISSPYETFDVNAMGTASILEAVRQIGRSCVVVIVTSDKCYESTSSSARCREADRLGGSEPYGASKAAAEIITKAYRETFFRNRNGSVAVSVASARAGNVIGGGDWSPHRMLPDIVRSLSGGLPIMLRSPHSVRPWQHVLAPLSGYLLLAAHMLSRVSSSELEDAWNFGPVAEGMITVQMVADKAIDLWGSGECVKVENVYGYHEREVLTLDIDKAVGELGWRPLWDFNRAMERTLGWYLEWQRRGMGGNMRDQCIADIDSFAADASKD